MSLRGQGCRRLLQVLLNRDEVPLRHLVWYIRLCFLNVAAEGVREENHTWQENQTAMSRGLLANVTCFRQTPQKTSEGGGRRRFPCFPVSKYLSKKVLSILLNRRIWTQSLMIIDKGKAVQSCKQEKEVKAAICNFAIVWFSWEDFKVEAAIYCTIPVDHFSPKAHSIDCFSYPPNPIILKKSFALFPKISNRWCLEIMGEKRLWKNTFFWKQKLGKFNLKFECN